MADYSIFVLGESQMTISGDAILDGVTQGDGSHLIGETITLNSGAWGEVQITDDDTDFRDNDSSQRLNGAQSIDGQNFADGTVVEAEFGLILSDGVNNWQVVGFNVRNSSPSYATIEGLAFIGGPGGFPPVGVPLTVLSAQEGPDFEQASYATPICYAAGTLVETDTGLRPIENLRAGDRVMTLDDGLVDIRWTGGRDVIAAGRFAPVEIRPGVLGANRTLRVSQQHRILLTSPIAELLFGTAEVFVPAIHLAETSLARVIPGGALSYHHIALESHAIILANGCAAETLHPPDYGTAAGALFFPDLATLNLRPGPLARRSLRRHEARVLLRSLLASGDDLTGTLQADMLEQAKVGVA
ncbi:Hint domain-containing protein [Primorskyibacter sp. S87]|uniref:Hint domain-containing protein n=1 Tax=Primorskyibacter sp. S87 TaxID=3415126 RepID=UPI003C7D433D